MKISVSSYSFNQYIKARKMTVFDTVAKAHELGFEAIEFIELPERGNLESQKELAKRIREEADRFGMEINAYTVGANLYRETAEESDAEVTRLCGQLDVAKILGCPVMRHDVCYKLGKTGNSRSFDLMLPTIAANARRVTEYAETLGIKTCTENHGYIAQDSDRVERLFNAVNHNNYGLLVDVGNFSCVDENNVTAVSRVAPYAIHVHAKDMAFSSEPKEGYTLKTRGCNYLKCTYLGGGDVNVKKCIEVLKRAGYDGYVSIEYEGAEDCIEGIKKGLEFLREII